MNTTEFFTELTTNCSQLQNDLRQNYAKTHWLTSYPDPLEFYENDLTLKNIITCLNNASLSNDDKAEQLKQLLAERWQRIRALNAEHSCSMGYTQQPFNAVNQLCLQIAKHLAPLPPTDEINAMLDFSLNYTCPRP